MKPDRSAIHALRTAVWLAGLSAPLLMPAVFTAPAHAQSKTAGKSDGRQGVIDGIKLYERGRYDKAIPQLTSAIKGGGLSSQDLAKALYYRGLAYQKSNQAANAVSDLTGAVWMDGGLSPGEQQNALAQRGKAYAVLGIPDPGPPRRGGSAGGTAVAAAPSASGGSAGGVSTSSGNPLSGVGNFFSNLFGGDSTAAEAPTASVSTPAAPPAATPTTGASNRQAAVSGWSSVTATSPAETPTLRPAPRKKTQVARANIPRGNYELQVAAVRSRGAAEELAARLTSAHGSVLGGRAPAIGEKVFGNMGTFYQVSVGPFASERETQPVCSQLKAGGFDCLVVKR